MRLSLLLLLLVVKFAFLLLLRLWRLQVCAVVFIRGQNVHASVEIQHVNFPQVQLVAVQWGSSTSTQERCDTQQQTDKSEGIWHDFSWAPLDYLSF